MNRLCRLMARLRNRAMRMEFPLTRVKWKRRGQHDEIVYASSRRVHGPAVAQTNDIVTRGRPDLQKARISGEIAIPTSKRLVGHEYHWAGDTHPMIDRHWKRIAHARNECRDPLARIRCGDRDGGPECRT